MGLIQNKVTVSQPNSHVVVKNAGGLRGLTGETGPQGPQGVPGEAATVTAGTTTTLPAGSAATVQNVGSTSAAIFNFGIPKGDKGDTGESGAAATISVGSTSTLPAGSSATVTNSGTSSAAVFDFDIPKGDKGDTGATGADGYSPSATVSKTGDTATITITDKDGTTTAQISDGVTPTIDPALSPTSENPVQNKVVTNALAGKTDKPIVVSSLPATGTAGQEYFVDDRYNTVTELKGDTEQTTYSGKNLADLVPITNVSSNYSQGVTLETVADATIGRNVLHIVSTTGYPSVVYNLAQRLQSGRYYALRFTYKSAFAGTNNNRKAMWFAPSWTTNSWDNLGSLGSSNSKGGDGITSSLVQQSTEWVTRSVRFYVTPTQYESVEASYSKLIFSLGYGISGEGCTDKELWLADAMLYEITESEWNATNYTSPDYEPYVGGTASPNPDYPQEVQTVTGRQVVTISDGGSQSQEYEINLGDIELCKIGTYQDYIYKSGEDWYVHKEIGRVLLDGSDTSNYGTLGNGTGGTKRFRYSRSDIGNVPDTIRTTYCDMYQGIQRRYTLDIPNSISQFTQQNMLNITTSSTTYTLGDYLSFLSSNPATVYYVLATPTDTQITNSALIAQLEALAEAKIMVDGGTATVTSQYLPATLTTAYNSNSGYIDYIYDGTNFVKVR